MPVIKTWMIYGANGYTGKLIAAEAARRGYQPILAGRNQAVITELAAKLNLPYRCFALESSHQTKQHLNDVGLVLNCAGPFEETAQVMREACLANGSHYLDITGELSVLESSCALDEEARKQGIAIISGVGFDVVPTDVLAHELKLALPEATHLELAFTGGTISRGTARTMLSIIADGCKVRENGKVVSVPIAHKSKEIPFADKSRYAMTIPWGDIATAYVTTGIPNIDIYTATKESEVKLVRCIAPLTKLLKIGFLTRALQAVAGKFVKGPSETELKTASVELWGRAWYQDGAETKAVDITMQTPDGYALTIKTALLYVEELLAHRILPGAYTPSQASDVETFLSLEGVSINRPNNQVSEDKLATEAV